MCLGWCQLSPSSSLTCCVYRINVTVRVDTEWINNFLFPAQAELVWPSVLADSNRLRLPSTHVGNMTVSTGVSLPPPSLDVTAIV